MGLLSPCGDMKALGGLVADEGRQCGGEQTVVYVHRLNGRNGRLVVLIDLRPFEDLVLIRFG